MDHAIQVRTLPSISVSPQPVGDHANQLPLRPQRLFGKLAIHLRSHFTIKGPCRLSANHVVHQRKCYIEPTYTAAHASGYFHPSMSQAIHSRALSSILGSRHPPADLPVHQPDRLLSKIVYCLTIGPIAVHQRDHLSFLSKSISLIHWALVSRIRSQNCRTTTSIYGILQLCVSCASLNVSSYSLFFFDRNIEKHSFLGADMFTLAIGFGL